MNEPDELIALQTALRQLRETLRQWDAHGASDPAYRGMELAEAVRAFLMTLPPPDARLPALEPTS